jgi:MFS family permease
MATFQPADNLRSRTFLALLVAQFLAAFNDQAIHASAMFFAINKGALNEAQAISLMPILFYAPWALFCTIAGYLADRYSKRSSLVFWKIAEVGITLTALLGFWLGTQGYQAGPFLVLSTVFLMGTHSAFFVPAKYGAMPEILQPQMLSRGNGVLESLSFLAVILGTMFGGILSEYYGGQEYLIGIILTGLAVIGAAASLFIRRMPAANPRREFPPYVFQPLWTSIRELLRSRPLALAVIGIAFFTFIVSFMRATVYMHGESHVPRWSESETSMVVGMVALGIGLGSPLVGFLSGGKVELGLVPIGALGMILAACLAAPLLDRLKGLILCIICIGFFTGFYIVPLFTLLQHRAPKKSKGDSIATSNFINVTGATAATLLFYVLVFGAQRIGLASPAEDVRDRVVVGELLEDPEYEHGRPHRFVIARVSPPAAAAGTVGLLASPSTVGPILAATTFRAEQKSVTVRDRGRRRTAIETDDDLIDAFGQRLRRGDVVIESTYKLGNVKHHRLRREGQEMKPVYNNSGLPRLLFLGASLMTLLTMLLLWWQMPDLFLRTRIWLRTMPHYRLESEGLSNLPDTGPALVVTNARSVESCLHVISATDRTTRFVLMEASTRWSAGSNGVEPHVLEKKVEAVLSRDGVVGLSLDAENGDGIAEEVLDLIAKGRSVPVLPVWYEPAPKSDRKRRQRIYILGGRLLPAGSSAAEVRRELLRVAEEFEQQTRSGESLHHVDFVGH